MGESHKAIEYFRETLKTFQEIGERHNEAVVLNSLGSAYESLDEYQKAIDCYQQSLTISREIGYRFCEAISLNNLGAVYILLKEYQKAIDYYQQSLTILYEISDKPFGHARSVRTGEANTLQFLAQLYYQIGKPKKAYITAFQAWKISREIKITIEEWNIPKWLKSLIKFAQSGKGKLILCFIFGVIAFPFVLPCILVLILWRVIRAKFSLG